MPRSAQGCGSLFTARLPPTGKQCNDNTAISAEVPTNGCAAIRLLVASEAATMRQVVEASVQRSRRYLPFWTQWVHNDALRSGCERSLSSCGDEEDVHEEGRDADGRTSTTTSSRRGRLAAVLFSPHQRQQRSATCNGGGDRQPVSDDEPYDVQTPDAATLLRSLSLPIGLLPRGDVDVGLFRLLYDAPRVSKSVHKMVHERLEAAVPLCVTPQLIQFVWVFLLEVLAPAGGGAVTTSSLDDFVASEWAAMEGCKGSRLYACLTEDPKRAMVYSVALWFLDFVVVSSAGRLGCASAGEHRHGKPSYNRGEELLAAESDLSDDDDAERRVRPSALAGSTSFDALLHVLKDPAAAGNADIWRVLDPTVALHRDTPLGDARAGLHEAYWLFLTVVTRSMELLPILEQGKRRLLAVTPPASSHKRGDDAGGSNRRCTVVEDDEANVRLLDALVSPILHPAYTVRMSVEHGRGATTAIQPVAVPEVYSKTLEKRNAVAARRGQWDTERRLQCLRDAETVAQRQEATCLRREKVCEESFLHRRKVQDRHARLIACRRQQQQQQQQEEPSSATLDFLGGSCAGAPTPPPMTTTTPQAQRSQDPPCATADATTTRRNNGGGRTCLALSATTTTPTMPTMDRRPFAAVSTILSAYDKHRMHRHRNAVWAAKWERRRWERSVGSLPPSAKVLTFFEG